VTQLASDDFARADANNLGGNWTKLGGTFTDIAIASQQAKGFQVSGDNCDAYTGVGAVNLNQWSQVTLLDASSNAADGGPTVRSDTTGTFYILDYQFTAGTPYQLFKCISHGFTLLNSLSPTVNNNDTLYIEVQGTTIICKLNGVTQITRTSESSIDGSTVGGPYPGIFIFSNSPLLDNFAMGNFVTPTQSAMHHFRIRRQDTHVFR